MLKKNGDDLETKIIALKGGVGMKESLEILSIRSHIGITPLYPMKQLGKKVRKEKGIGKD